MGCRRRPSEHTRAAPGAAVRTARSTFDILQAAARARRSGHAVAGPFDAPRARFNASLTPRRSVAFGTIGLAEVKATKRAFGTTLNDVVLAACTGGLRSFMIRTGDLPDRPLCCAVPVSVHHRSGADAVNQVSNMFVHLPVQLEDPVAQLRAVQRGSKGAKVVQAATAPEMIGDTVDLVPPSVFTLGARLLSLTHAADVLPPSHNLVVSNVQGSPVPLYLAGARLDSLYPFGPLIEGAGLNISLLSMAGDIDLGLIACPDLVADLDVLLDDILEAFETLHHESRSVKRSRGGAANH